MVREFDNNKEEFPMEKDTFVDLLYVLFRWMYKNKWTDHKLVRRIPIPIPISIPEQDPNKIIP